MNLAVGIALTALAGAVAGNCMLPLKFLKRWAWENAWFAFTIVSLLLLPWGMALLMVSDLGRVYGGLRGSEFVLPAVFGFGWGIAQVLFGLSIARLGLALGYAIIVGLGALLGTLVPLFVQSRADVDSSRLGLILSGVAIMIAGIAVSAFAGQRREAKQPSSRYGAAVAVAVLCGFLAPMLNYGFAFGRHIATAAAAAGNSAASAGYAVWPVVMGGGFIPNIVYAVYLLGKNRTWNRFAPGASETRHAVLMAVFWFGAMALYGVAATFLGALGTSVGWALFQIFMIMSANASGMLTGEWREAPRPTVRLFWLGFAMLAIATVVISFGNKAA